MSASNSAGVIRRLSCLARKHRAALLAVVLVLSALCFRVVPAATLNSALGQSAILAVLAIAAASLSDERMVKAPRLRRSSFLASASQPPVSRGVSYAGDFEVRRSGRGRPAWGWVAYLLAIALAGGIASWWVAEPFLQTPLSSTVSTAFSQVSDATGNGASSEFMVTAVLANIVTIVALCFLTGVFEEGVFRALAIDALAPAFGEGRRGLMGAAIASSILFGLLHVSVEDMGAANAIVWVQVVLKPLQAGLFGLFMASLFVRTRNLWIVAGVHGAFNLLYSGPLMLATGGVQATYTTGAPADAILLAMTTLLLLPLGLVALHALRERP